MGLADRDYMKAESWQREQRARLAAWHWRSLPRGWRALSRRQLVSRYAIVAVAALGVGSPLAYAAGAKWGPFKSEPARPYVEWSGQRFYTQPELAAWLRARGGDYSQWARNHPGAAARIEGGTPPG